MRGLLGDADRDALRRAMPALLASRCGVTDLTRNFRCPSPEHFDRNPSARYYPEDQRVHCFGCGKSWDAFELVGLLDGLTSFAEQAEALAAYAGIRLGDADRNRQRKRPYTRRAQGNDVVPPYEPPKEAGGGDVLTRCQDAYLRLYQPEGDVGRDYLYGRGLDDRDILNHGLGFVRRPRDLMPEFRVYEPGALGFIAIPFYDRTCSVATYAMLRTVTRGRARNKEWRPKGLISPLWREWLLRTAQPVVYICEGPLDAMSLEKLIGRPCLGLGGLGQAKRLASVLYHTPRERRPRKVVIALDEDKRGREAAVRVAHDLDVIGIPHATMPPYPGGAKDANDWLMAGRGTRWYFEETPFGPGRVPLCTTRWCVSHGR